MFQVSVDFTLPSIERINQAIAAGMNEGGAKLKQQLEAGSPVDTGEFAQNWQIENARAENLTLTISNRVEAALFRAVGRAPGRMPPSGNLPGGYLQARAIARYGTKRWREKKNVLGLDPVTGEYQPDSILLRARDDIVQTIVRNLKTDL